MVGDVGGTRVRLAAARGYAAGVSRKPHRLVTPVVLVGALALAFGSCGGGRSATTPPIIPPGTARLSWVVQPDGGLAGTDFGAPLRVQLLDAAGQPDAARAPVTLTLVDPAGTAALEGSTTSHPSSDGVAVFDEVRIGRAGRGLQLEARAPGYLSARSVPFDRAASARRRHVILMIADGWGFQQVAATRSYTGRAASYEAFERLAMATWDLDVAARNGTPGYDPSRAWTNLGYVLGAATDSAASATAMFTGIKTRVGRIGVGPEAHPERLMAISELALRNGLGSGAVTSVPISHATPAAWIAHTNSRGNTIAITGEALFGEQREVHGNGDLFAAAPLGQVLFGAGHPRAMGPGYVSDAQLARVRSGAEPDGGWTVIDRYDPRQGPGYDAVAALQRAAADPGVGRLFGLFGGAGGNLPFRRADGSGADPREPTLAQLTTAALRKLGQNPAGFFLMVEGGAVDWAGHANNLDLSVGEMIGFDQAVAAVVAWIEDPTNGSGWDNTLLLVTGDHETGLLSAGPGELPDKPLGAVTAERLAFEQVPRNHVLRMSWDDRDHDLELDFGEEVYWSWNTSGHSNSLIPCFFKGLDADRLRARATAVDPVRGNYCDNTDLYRVMLDVLQR